MALGPLYAARPGVLLPPQTFVRRPAEWLKAISRYRGTVSFAPNFAYDLAVRRVKDRDLEGMDLSCWRIAGCGAEPISAPTLAAFAERFSAVGFRAASFLPCYGLAEHVLAATLPRRDRPPRVEHVSVDQLATRRQAVVAQAGESSLMLVCCGQALPGHEIRIVGDDGRTAGEREVGEIALAGPSVMLGYYGDDEATGQTIRERMAPHRRSRLHVGRRAFRVRPGQGRHHRQRTEISSAGSGVGGRPTWLASVGIASSPSESSRRAAADRVVMVVERSNAAAADGLVDAIRRRIGDVFGLYVERRRLRPERKHRPDDERQGAAGGDQNAVCGWFVGGRERLTRWTQCVIP